MTHIKDSYSYPLMASTPARHISMPMAIVIAVITHVGIIFGIRFSQPDKPATLMQDVAKALMDTKQPNKDANFIANASQIGGGSVRENIRQQSAQVSPLSAPTMMDTQDAINLQPQVSQQRYQESYLRTTLSFRHANAESDNKTKQARDDLVAQEARVRKQIATLEAQLSERQQVLASQSKVAILDSNSTTRGAAADYIETFRTHVERVGNLHYPAQARARGITGDVRLMVIISDDGRVKAIRLLESSGSSLLDEAAKQSVRAAAPFGKFSDDMRDMTELRLIRTYRYSDKIDITY